MTLRENNHRILALWLFTCCGMIAAMIVIGAITRLTESGLSMVEWRAAMDMLPPLNQEAWNAAFHKYQASPEFLDKNSGMDLAQYKNIYFWEWLHRLWGRLIGLVYALPLLYFWLRGRIPNELKPRFILFLALGGLQGFIGWYMVKSGLVNEPRVSHYRLALHLGTALVLFSALWAQALPLWPRSADALWRNYIPALQKYRAHGWVCLAVLSVTILWGAFVAGLDAGMIYNEFPLMGGKLMPGEIFFLSPAWKNFLENPAAVQFTHRVLGIATFLVIFSFALEAWQSRNWLLQRFGIALGLIVLLQLALGIATLLSRVDIILAAAHQANALVLLATTIAALLFLQGRKN
ncbi:MAG: heme synthase [Alphaproteobacteria bacterium]|nr:heme synthase [Alphaproteobacteria bacterium]